MNKELEQKVLQKMNELFVWKRNEYILQNPDGSYCNTKDLPYNSKITDKVMLSHIRRKETIGVFGNPNNCKFICWDVDDTDNSKMIVKRIVAKIQSMGISSDYIKIIDSANKGFHIFIFFDSINVYQSEAQTFYKYVIQECGVDSKQVEYRATSGQAVKLPLSIHKKTGRVSYFVDENFNHIKDYNYFLAIRQFDSIYFKEIVSSIKTDKRLDKMNMAKRSEFYKNLLDKISMSEAVDLENTGLKRTGTRNESCIAIARLYNTQNYSKEDCLDKLNNWMHSQDACMYTTKQSAWIKENKRIVDWVYKNNVRFGKSKNTIMNYTTEELENIIKYKDASTKMMAFGICVQANRFGKDEFYFTYNDIMDKCEISSKETVSKNMKLFKEDGLISVLNLDGEGKRNIQYIPETNTFIRENHIYSYNFKYSDSDNISNFNIVEDDFKGMFRSIYQLNYTKRELTTMFGRRQYKTFFENL